MAATRHYVFCYLPGEVAAVPAGRFDHDDVDRVGMFAYGRRYANRPGALAVDCVALPLGADPMPVATNGGLYGAFRDASPDHWGRLVIASGLKCPVEALSEIDYLSHANATRVGNLDFRPSLDSPEPTLGPPEFQDIEDLLIAFESTRSGLRTICASSFCASRSTSLCAIRTTIPATTGSSSNRKASPSRRCSMWSPR